MSPSRLCMLGIWVKFLGGPWSHAYRTLTSAVRSAVPQRCREGDCFMCWLGTYGPVSGLWVEVMPSTFLTREPWALYWDGGVPRSQKTDLYIDWMVHSKRFQKRWRRKRPLQERPHSSNSSPVGKQPPNLNLMTGAHLLIQHPSILCPRIVVCEYKEHVARYRVGTTLLTYSFNLFEL